MTGAAASCSCRCPWSSRRTRPEDREKNRSGPVSRVLSPPLSEWAVNIHLGPWLPRGLISEQPERMGRAIPVPRTAGTRSYWLLLQVGFSVPSESPRTRCALTAPFHPYRPLAEPAVCFLWHFPASCLDWPLASTLPCGARTFLPSPMPAVTSVHPDHSGPPFIHQGRGARHIAAARRWHSSMDLGARLGPRRRAITFLENKV